MNEKRKVSNVDDKFDEQNEKLKKTKIPWRKNQTVTNIIIRICFLLFIT